MEISFTYTQQGSPMENGISLILRKQDKKAEARICVVSLPLSEENQGLKILKGMKSQVVPVGYWPNSKKVRRQLMFGITDKEIPERVEVIEGEEEGEYEGPEIFLKVIKEKKTGIVLMEEDEIEIRYKGKKIGIRIGLIHKGELHWWEWVRMQELWRGSVCKGILAGGFIEVERTTDEEIDAESVFEMIHQQKYHNHNCLRGCMDIAAV